MASEIQSENKSGREDIMLGLNWNEESTENSESNEKKFRGFHLTRSKWDPYPWIGSVETGSDAEVSGLRAGDCLLQIDGEDLLGLKMSEIAFLIGKKNRVRTQVWRRRDNFEKKYDDKEEINHDDEKKHLGVLSLEGPLPEVAIKLSSAVSGVVRALECPICLESARIPVSQCVNGHILCVGCRAKSTRCPVCRVSLGQGRCLLADKCHKVLVESFGVKNTRNNAESALSKRLFGPRKTSEKEKINRSPQRAKNLISRIFPSISLDEKAASTESLPATRFCDNATTVNNPERKWLLSRSFDRTKSASTGELSREKNRSVSGSLNRLTNNEIHTSNGLLSVPPTPLWGGSTESVINSRINCPLWKKAGCHELFTSGTILEHLSSSHSGPLIHFYQGKIVLPIPWPFSPEGIYILHQSGEMFFLQSENESISIQGSNMTENKWNWCLNVLDEHKTELKFHKEVISLQEPLNTSFLNVAILPKNLSFKSVEIHLLENQSNEGIEL